MGKHILWWWVPRQRGGSVVAALYVHEDPPPSPPHIPIIPPVPPSSGWEQERSRAGRQSGGQGTRGGEKKKGGRGEEGGGGEEKGLGGGWCQRHTLASWPATLANNINSSRGGPADCLLKDLAFLFVFLQGPAEKDKHTLLVSDLWAANSTTTL